MLLSARWFHRLEFVVLLGMLIALGVVHFSRITLSQQRQIELEVGFEQLYLLEQAYFEQHGVYFDPTDPDIGLQWRWMEAYEWEVRILGDGFWIVAQGDLDGDGEQGAWSIDDKDPRMRQLTND